MIPAVVVAPFGREAEFAAISATIADTQSRMQPAGVVLAGAAGAGKTTLWRAVVGSARESGHIVLACSPAAHEASLGLAALGDLLRDVPRPRC